MTDSTEFGGYQTRNADLAALLHVCGVRFYRDEATGQELRITNIYDVKSITAAGEATTGNGPKTPIRIAARRAYDKGKPGALFFHFEKNEVQQSVEKAWLEAEDAMRVADKPGGTTRTDLATINAEPAELAAFLAIVRKHKRMLLSQWKNETAYVMAGQAKSEPGSKEHQTVIRGSFKLCNIFAGEETREHLGIK